MKASILQLRCEFIWATFTRPDIGSVAYSGFIGEVDLFSRIT